MTSFLLSRLGGRSPGQATLVPGLAAMKGRKLLASVLLFLSTALGNAAEPVLSLDYHHSLRIPHSHVRITVDTHGRMTVVTESRGKDKATRQVPLPLKVFRDLKRDLDAIDWAKVSAEKTTGADGTLVRISFGNQSAVLWSPDYDSRKRGLGRVQRMIERIFDLAGLDRAGMPR